MNKPREFIYGMRTMVDNTVLHSENLLRVDFKCSHIKGKKCFQRKIYKIVKALNMLMGKMLSTYFKGKNNMAM